MIQAHILESIRVDSYGKDLGEQYIKDIEANIFRAKNRTQKSIDTTIPLERREEQWAQELIQQHTESNQEIIAGMQEDINQIRLALSQRKD